MFFSRLMPWSRRSEDSKTAEVPPGVRIYAIGDVHGRLDLLESLLTAIDNDIAQRPEADARLVFLGDLIDRGPASASVVDRAIDLQRGSRPARFLMGNHEEVFLRAIDGDVRSTRLLVRIGGRETLYSYGLTADEYQALDYDALTALLAERVPAAHVDFLRGLEDVIEYGDYAFVHAGIRPGVALGSQKVSDLRWIRDEFLDHDAPHDRIIVHGHSITEEIDQRENRIGIDTGAFASGRLTAIALEGADRWFLQTGD
jgi:serine/threonine protein phosphatase 1